MAGPTPDFDLGVFGDDYLYFMADVLTLEAAEEAVDPIWRLLELEPGLEVLDLACGDGRIANGLAQRGARVTGLDLTPCFLEVRGRTPRNAGSFSLRMVTAPGLRDWLRDAGFEDGSVSDWAGEPFALESRRMVTVARKAKPDATPGPNGPQGVPDDPCRDRIGAGATTVCRFRVDPGSIAPRGSARQPARRGGDSRGR
jgi:SAM-dependent methyltransferase